MFTAATDQWRTPPALYEALHREFDFTKDPCPLDGTVDALSPLFCRWEGQRVFCNPPYGRRVRAWLERGLEADLAVFLLPARTDTAWFHELVVPLAAEIRFLRGRLNFGDGAHNAPFPSLLAVFRRPSSTGGCTP